MTNKGKTVKTVVRDCLYLNWAFPLDTLPEPPDPLRYEVHSLQQDRFVFGSVLLFRHESLHIESLPVLKISFPQFHLRLHVLDHDEVPAVWLRHILVPGWVVPGLRWLGQQPAEAARFRFPRPSIELDLDTWRWEVVRGDSLVVSARQASPRVGSGPTLGSWQQVVDCVRLRERAYVAGAAGLRAIHTSQRSVPLWPMDASLEEVSLLRTSKALRGVDNWPDLHSAWICPEIPFTFEMAHETVGANKMRRPAAPVAPDPAMFGSTTRSSHKSAF